MNHSSFVLLLSTFAEKHLDLRTSERKLHIFWRELQLRGGVKTSDICNLSSVLRTSVVHPANAVQERKSVHQDPAERYSNDIFITVVKENKKGKDRQRRDTAITTTCIPLAYLCVDFFSHLFSQKSHLEGGRKSGLTNWCDFGPQGFCWVGPLLVLHFNISLVFAFFWWGTGGLDPHNL